MLRVPAPRLWQPSRIPRPPPQLHEPAPDAPLTVFAGEDVAGRGDVESLRPFAAAAVIGGRRLAAASVTESDDEAVVALRQRERAAAIRLRGETAAEIGRAGRGWP